MSRKLIGLALAVEFPDLAEREPRAANADLVNQVLLWAQHTVPIAASLRALKINVSAIERDSLPRYEHEHRRVPSRETIVRMTSGVN